MTTQFIRTTTKTVTNFRDRLLQLKLRAFQPKIEFETHVNNFTIKTVTKPEELQEVLKLRYQVFIREGLNKTNFSELDFDRYDLLADHIIVKDQKENRTVGTYRLLSSQFTNEFYSQNEFHLDTFLSSQGSKLELGRACIHPFYRTGSSLSLVWKGIGEYAKSVRADYLFGCASVSTTCPKLSLALYNHTKPHHSYRFQIEPTKNYRFSDDSLRGDHGIFSTDYLDDKIPSLLKSYIKAGALIHGFPAFDSDFSCIDFMTILNIHTMNEKFKYRYFL